MNTTVKWKSSSSRSRWVPVETSHIAKEFLSCPEEKENLGRCRRSFAAVSLHCQSQFPEDLKSLLTDPLRSLVAWLWVGQFGFPHWHSPALGLHGSSKTVEKNPWLAACQSFHCWLRELIRKQQEGSLTVGVGRLYGAACPGGTAQVLSGGMDTHVEIWLPEIACYEWEEIFFEYVEKAL